MVRKRKIIEVKDLRLISTGARLGTIQHAHKERLFPFKHSLLCVAQCARSCVRVAWQRFSALTQACGDKMKAKFLLKQQVLYNVCAWKKQSAAAFERISALQAPAKEKQEEKILGASYFSEEDVHS